MNNGKRSKDLLFDQSHGLKAETIVALLRHLEMCGESEAVNQLIEQARQAHGCRGRAQANLGFAQEEASRAQDQIERAEEAILNLCISLEARNNQALTVIDGGEVTYGGSDEVRPCGRWCGPPLEEELRPDPDY